MESAERLVKIVWMESDCNGRQEPHAAHGVLVDEAGEHFILRVDGTRLLYVLKRLTTKMIDEGGPRQ
jgi:hypothetical protein